MVAGFSLGFFTDLKSDAERELTINGYSSTEMLEWEAGGSYEENGGPVDYWHHSSHRHMQLITSPHTNLSRANFNPSLVNSIGPAGRTICWLVRL